MENNTPSKLKHVIVKVTMLAYWLWHLARVQPHSTASMAVDSCLYFHIKRKFCSSPVPDLLVAYITL